MDTTKRIAVFAFLLFPQWAFAQIQESIVVEATPIYESRIEPSRSTSVVDQDELQKRNHHSVGDALRSLPGIEVIRHGTVGQTTSLFIRGARSEDTLVLIDGAEVNDAISPSNAFEFSSLSPENIARIEVYHGPQSVRFGAGALGGVVNIITKEGGEKNSIKYGLEGGTYQTHRANIGAQGKLRKFGYSLTADAITTKGFSAALSKNGDADGAKIYSGSTKLTYSPSDTTKLELISRYTDADTEIDNGGGTLGDDPNHDVRSKHYVGGIAGSTRFFNERLKSSLGFYFSEMDRKGNNPPDGNDPTDNIYTFLSENIKTQSDHHLLLGEDHEIRLSLQWREEKGRSYSEWNGAPTFLAQEDQDVFGGSLTYLFENESWFFDIGVRGDDSSAVGSITSHRASAGRFFNEKRSKAYLSYGTGYKLPSLYQLYSIYGDTTLKNEEAHSYEATIETTIIEPISLAVTGFENKYENLIDFNTITSQYYNVAKARSRGVEVESHYQMLPSLKWVGRYTYLDAIDETDHVRIVRRPHNAWSLSADYSREKWNTFIRYRFKGKRPDIDPTSFNRIEAKAYDVVDIGARYALMSSFKLNGRIENVFDRNYEESAGYTTAGLSVFAGISGEL